jgi:homopolymeric O-antigen transport system permease protein
MTVITNERARALDNTTPPEPVSISKPEQEKVTGLPEEPITVITPSKSWVSLNLRDLWASRELLYFLTWRDIKVRYKQTALGVIWVVLQPLLTTIVFTIFLGQLARVPSDGLPYPLFVYAGMLPWTFFASAISTSGNSLVGSAGLITKVYFPRLIIPATAVAARVLDFLISFIILLGLMLYYGITPGRNILILPPLVITLGLLALGFGMWTSALNVKYRDVGVVMPVLIQLLMFASPVVYGSSIVPEKYQWLYFLNPMAGLLQGFRTSLFGGAFNWPALGFALFCTVSLLAYSAYAFRRMEKSFADIV